MQSIVVADSSTIFALERAGLISLLGKTDYRIFVPKAVAEEIKKGKNKNILKILEVTPLKGKSYKYARNLERFNIGKGEAQCCALAHSLKQPFFICDDRKFIRQRFFSDNEALKNIAVAGFAFFLDAMHKKGLIRDVWPWFDKIIKVNNWQRSEVEVANYTYLKELGY